MHYFVAHITNLHSFESLVLLLKKLNKRTWSSWSRCWTVLVRNVWGSNKIRQDHTDAKNQRGCIIQQHHLCRQCSCLTVVTAVEYYIVHIGLQTLTDFPSPRNDIIIWKVRRSHPKSVWYYVNCCCSVECHQERVIHGKWISENTEWQVWTILYDEIYTFTEADILAVEIEPRNKNLQLSSGRNVVDMNNSVGGPWQHSRMLEMPEPAITSPVVPPRKFMIRSVRSARNDADVGK